MTKRTHDHELKINDTTDQFTLVRDDNDVAMYQVTEETPAYQAALAFAQNNWVNGHGQFHAQDPTQYFEGQSIDTTVDGKLMLGPLITEVKENDDTDLDSAPTCFLWVTGITPNFLLCATAGKIYKYGTKWTPVTTTVAGVTQMVEYNGVIYAAAPTVGTGDYWYSPDGSNWNQSDLDDSVAGGFFVSPNAAGTDNVLWKFGVPGSATCNQIASTTSGESIADGGVQWTSPAYIGSTSTNIINMLTANGELLIGKLDNLYYYDSAGGVHTYMDDLRVAWSTNNFKYVTYCQSAAYFSRGTSLGELSNAGTFDQMGPLTEIDDIGKVGTCVGLASDGRFLYAAMDEGTNTHIYKGKEVATANGLRWQWCPWVFLSTKTCAAAYVAQHSETDKRLWFGYSNSTAYVTITDNSAADTSARFCPSGFIRMSYTYGTNPNWDKLWQSAILETANLTTGITAQVKYRKDTDTSATACTSATTTNGVQELNFTASLVSKRIQFEIHLLSGTSTVTPIVTYFQAKGVEKPTTVRTHESYYSVGDRPSDRVKTIRDLLRTARTSTTLVKFADLRYGQKTSGSALLGDFYWCVVMPGFPKEVEVKHEKGRAPELAIQIKLQELAFEGTATYDPTVTPVPYELAGAVATHSALTTGVHGVGTGTVAKVSDIVATQLDDFATPDDTTDLNASTSRHGLLLKATAPAANVLNVVGIANGETAYTNKVLFDATNPAALGTAAPGTSLVAAHRDHVHTDPVPTHAALITGVHGLVITAGKTFTLTASLTLSGTDASTLNIGTGGTLGTAAYTATTAYEAAGGIATHAALTTGVHGLAITAGQTLTVTTGGTLGSAAYTATTAYEASGGIATHAALTTTHGVTGAIVGTTDTQELDNKTLDTSVAKGTWTASGTWAIPAVTLGGIISGGGYALNSLGHIGVGITSNSVVGVYNSEAFTNAGTSYGIVANNTVTETIAHGDSFHSEFFCTGIVGAANTKNWTATLGFKGFSTGYTIVVGATGTITGMVGVDSIFTINAMTVTNLYHIYFPDATGAGTVVNQYGIYIGALTKGTTLNWGIYNLAKTYLGDDLYLASGKVLRVNSVQVVGTQGATVADATDAASVILRLNDLLARCRAHGLIAT